MQYTLFTLFGGKRKALGMTVLFSLFSITLFSQISITVKDQSIKQILYMIESKSEYKIFFSSDLPDLDKRVDFSVNNKSIDFTLSKLFKDVALSYEKRSNKQIVVFSTIKGRKVNRKISGTVTDKSGEPIIGANVSIEGTTTGTISDVDGKFVLEVPEKGVLSVSYLGYRLQRVDLTNKSLYEIVLEEDTKILDEVVVVGYGTQKRVTMTSAVASMKGDDIKSMPVGNVSNVLGGMVSGIITKQSSGAPGADQATVYIRGTEPSLVLVDGVETSTWQRINTQDIESISILKDASAVAPYGLKGANGVMLITTRRGKAGKISLNYNGEFGWQKPTNTPSFMNAYDGLVLKNKAYEMDGTPDLMTDPETLEQYRTGLNPDAYPNTDWIKNYMKTSNTQKHNLSLSGGSDIIHAFVSLGYFNQQSMFADNIGFDRYSLRSNIDLTPLKTTKVSLDVSLTQDERYWKGTDPKAVIEKLYLLPATQPDVFTNGLPAQQADGSSLYQLVHAGGESSEQNDIQNVSLTVNQDLPFLKGLSVKGVAYYQRQTKDLKNWVEPYTAYTYDNANKAYEEQNNWLSQKPRLSQEYKRWTNYTFQAHLNYNRKFGLHDVGALAVYERRLGETKSVEAARTNYLLPIPELSMGSTDKANQSNAGSSYKTASDGFVARLNYQYDSKYLVELAGRYDRSYKYAPGRRSAFFPSASIGWRISEEDFIKDNISIIDNLKLRASYGKSGNPVGGDFEYMARYQTSSGYIWGGLSETPVQEQGLYIDTEPNVYLTWETVWKTDVGFDLMMWNGLLGIEFDYYYDRRSDKILKARDVAPVEYGIGLADENAGKEKRWGVDLSLTNNTRFSSKFSMQNSFVFGFTRNKQVEIREEPGTLNNPRQRRTGLSSGLVWGYKSAGLFADDADVANWAYQKDALPGDVKYVDINHDGKIDNDDQVVIGGSSIPEIMWGYNLRLTYGQFDLAMLIQGTGKSDYYLGSADRGVRYPFDNNKPRIDHRDSWTVDNPNPNAKYPRLSATKREQNYVSSDFWMVNTSYVKLKSLELGYNFKPSLIKKAFMQNLRIYLNFYNLWTIFSRMSKDFDCENQTYNAYPQQFISSVGVNVVF